MARQTMAKLGILTFSSDKRKELPKTGSHHKQLFKKRDKDQIGQPYEPKEDIFVGYGTGKYKLKPGEMNQPSTVVTYSDRR